MPTTPDLAPTASFSYDRTGQVFFTGGVSGGYGVLPVAEVSPEYLLGILNSRVVDFYHHKVATSMRGGWYSYESRFIRNLPIAPASQQQRFRIAGIVSYLIWLNESGAVGGEGGTAQETQMYGYFEQLLNALAV
jgi:hypothetical protein